MSKDERYDVTQHDGITEGKWEIRHSGTCIDVVVYADDEKRAFSPIINFTRELGHLVMKIDRDRADLEAIASLPEILDALKKAYEENDNLEWLLAKAHGEGNMVHSLVHLGVKQQVEKLQTENTRLRDSLFIINEDMKDCEVGGMSHVRKIINFVNDVCEAERITPHE